MGSSKFFLVLFLIPALSYAQQSDSLQTSTVNKKRLYTSTAVASVGYGVTLLALNNLWYKNSPREDFHFFNDNNEWRQVDKVGHAFSAFYISQGASLGLQWCGVKEKKSNWIGALTGFLVLVPIEILDGYSSAYGASTGDLIADAGGALLFWGQTALWNKPRIYPKFSFHQTSFADLRPNVLGDTFTSQLLKDYNGQTYWLSFDMDKFIRFPKWLNLAVGYGAEGMVYANEQSNNLNGYKAYRQYYFSLDLDLTAIKTKSKAVRSLLFFANMIKIPAPTLEFSTEGTRFHFLYF